MEERKDDLVFPPHSSALRAFKTRRWQKHAFSVVDGWLGRKETDEEKRPTVVVPVNACVGSGKTAVGCYAFGKFIRENESDKTVQMFVTPRIRLCDQQNKEIENFLESEFGLKNGPDYALIGVDCTKHEFNVKSDLLESKHTIFVICDESLWGKAKDVNPETRWLRWLKKFSKWHEAGFKFGWIVLDEAHNYDKNERLMFDSSEDLCLAHWFMLMPMTGTPAAYQREWSKRWPKNVCSCSPKEAMENGWICKPTLNLVIGDKDSGWARAIVAALNREKWICETEEEGVFKPRLMINCSGIDDIKQIVDLEWIKEHVKTDFHLITLHSTKGYDDGTGVLDFAKPTIDCEDVDADEAYAAIEAIDSNSYFKDGLPIVVAQVAMLGEGINVTSFNAILTASNAEKTAMQQIGRCIRNYKLGDKEKVTDGHANVYVLTDNVSAIKQLLINLEEFDLTDECFQWGDKIDIMTGSGLIDLADGVPSTLNSFAWDPIDPEHDLDIIEMMRSMKSKLYDKAGADMFSLLFGDKDGDGVGDAEELEGLLYSLSSRGLSKLWSKHSFSKDEKPADAGKKKKREVGEDDGKDVSEDLPKPAKDDSVVDEEKAKKKSETKRSNPTYEVFMTWLLDIKNAIRSSKSAKKLWSIDREMCIGTVLQSEEVAKFLVDHVDTNKLDRLFK